MSIPDLSLPQYSHLHCLIQDEYVTLYLDRTADWVISGACLHLDIHQWSPSIYKTFLVRWENIKKALYEAGYTSVYATPITSKQRKLLRMFGLRDTGVYMKSLQYMRVSLCHK